ERMRRVGMLMFQTPDEPQGRGRLEEVLQRLPQPGWGGRRNISIDIRWAGGSRGKNRTGSGELGWLRAAGLGAPATLCGAALPKTTRTVPIVFAFAADPVGAGFVGSLARPGGNTTGFMQFEYSLSGKWVELLKEIAPSVTRAAVVRDPANPSGSAQFAVVQAV